MLEPDEVVIEDAVEEGLPGTGERERRTDAERNDERDSDDPGDALCGLANGNRAAVGGQHGGKDRRAGQRACEEHALHRNAEGQAEEHSGGQIFVGAGQIADENGDHTQPADQPEVVRPILERSEKKRRAERDEHGAPAGYSLIE